MEKLMKLLNEYQKKINEKEENNYEIFERKLNGDSIRMNDLDDPYEWLNMYWWYAKARLIAKQFWFIERLIKKDKIDTFRILEKRFDTQKWCEREHYHTVNEWNTNLLLMLLAISENPIEFLISVLK